jgi:hypothetical protein
MNILADRPVDFVQRLRARRSGWIWLIGLAFTSGVGLVLVACTVHDRCSSSDPACLFHSFTLVHTAGPAILGFVGAPAVISLVIAMLLRIKVTRRSIRADRAAWFFAALSCLICIVGLAVEGFLMLLEAVLTVCAVAAAPFPPDPNDRLLRSGGGWRRPTPPD